MSDRDIALAVIGGTGLYKLADLQDVRSRTSPSRTTARPPGRSRIGTLGGASRRLPGAPRRRPFAAAAPDQLPRQPGRAAGAGRAARARAQHRRRHHRALRPARAGLSGPAHRLHLGPHLARSARNRAPRCCMSISASPTRARCAQAVLAAARRAGVDAGRRRLLRRHPGAAPGDTRRDRAHAPRRLRPGRHDRHARGRRWRARWGWTTPAWRSSPTGRPAPGPDPDEVITLQDVLDNVAAASAGLPDLLRALLAG